MTQNPLTRNSFKADSRTLLWARALALGTFSAAAARGHLAAFDARVLTGVAVWRCPELDGVMRAAAFFGSSTWLVIGLIGLALIGRWNKGSAPGPILFGSFLIAFLLEMALRLSVAQWRPDAGAVPPSMDVLTRFQLAGFPSGHGVRSAFVFGWLIRHLKAHPGPWARAGTRGCLVMIGLVGLTRLYLNRHWPSDVLGSWLVVLVAFAVADIWRKAFEQSAHKLDEAAVAWQAPARC